VDYVFISYSHQDAAYVAEFAESLQRQGVDAWLDSEIDYGDAWPDVIEEHLDSSAAVVVVMSDSARDSRWVQNELTRAQRRNLPIFPLLLNGEAWLALETTQHVDVRDGNLPPEEYCDRLKLALQQRDPAAPRREPRSPPQPTPRGATGGDQYSIHVTGDVSGQVAAGRQVRQVQSTLPETADQQTARILVLAANPRDTDELRLGEEVRAIDERLRFTKYRDRLELVQHWAARITDLSEAILRHRPHVVHFSGHGSPAGAVVLEDAVGMATEVPSKALGDLFGIVGEGLLCVVLNACHTATQAGAIVEHVDCVIGTTAAIGDEAAVRFAGGFYTAIGYGKSIKTAFDLGRNEIDLAALGEKDIPTLLTRPGVDPAAISVVGPG
jgi:hypothetical protein